MINVIIADDHRLVAEGIAKLITDSKDINVTAIAESIDEARRLVTAHHPDVLLLDVAMPDGDGIDAISTLRQLYAPLRIIILTVYAEPNVVHRAKAAGANGYILKSTDSEELFNGIRTVAEGSSYICRETQTLMEHAEQPPTRLNNREREILRLIVKGHSIKEIADILNLGFETVHSYTKYLRQKLGCSNMAALVRTAIEQHLI